MACYYWRPLPAARAATIPPPTQIRRSLTPATAREEAILDSAASLTLTADSIGCIRIGMAVDRIPRTVAGFYASTTLDSTPDAQTISFNDPQGDPIFTAYDFMEGKVDVIALNGTRYGVGNSRG